MTTKNRQTIRLFYLSLLFLFCLQNSFEARAQVDCFYKTLHLSNVHGVAVDFMGRPIAEAVVSLSRKGSEAIETKTDARGQFSFSGVSGHYDFSVKARGFSETWSPVDVGFDVRNLFHSNTLHVIVSVGSPVCPTLTTSKREFQNKIAAYNRQYKGIDQKNATQK